jgi:cholesterol oxidase
MTSSVRFTEEMLGHVTFGELDFARGAQPDRDGSGAFKFHLTIEVEDIESFSNDPLRPATAVGWIESDAFGGKLPVQHGWFNLFVDVEPGVKHMLYRLWFNDGVGHPLTMTGFKLVKDDAGFDVWKDTTTLFTRVLQGHVEEGGDDTATILASGIIIIRARDFAKQLTTFRAGGPGIGSQLGALTKFGVIFAQQLAEAYLRKGRRGGRDGVRA